MFKTSDLMVQTIQDNNLGNHIPKHAKKKPRENAPKTQVNVHALIAINYSPNASNIDSIYVIRNIAPSADRSCSSGLNGSDPEQMSE